MLKPSPNTEFNELYSVKFYIFAKCMSTYIYIKKYTLHRHGTQIRCYRENTGMKILEHATAHRKTGQWPPAT